MMLEQITRRQEALIALRNQVRSRAEAAAAAAVRGKHAETQPDDTRTIGVRVPAELRARIEAHRERLGLPSYTAAVAFAVEVGADALDIVEATAAKSPQR